MIKNLKNNYKNNKPKKDRFCALLDKPCIGDECAQHFDKFDKCSFELIPYNMYPLTKGMNELVGINQDLMGALKDLTAQLKDVNGQKQLFT